MNLERAYSRRQLWKFVTAILMVTAGCACFILSCVASMILCNRE